MPEGEVFAFFAYCGEAHSLASKATVSLQGQVHFRNSFGYLNAEQHAILYV